MRHYSHCFVFQKHPAVEIIERSLNSWLDFVGTLRDIWPEVRWAWRLTYQQVIGPDGVARWQKVRGPIGALIATLSIYG